MNKEELLLLLMQTKVETIRCFNLAEHDLGKTYGPGKWNVRQILHHLTDTELLFQGRLKKIIAEPRQVIWAFNQDDWNRAFQYEHASLAGKETVYGYCRELNYQLIDCFYESHKSTEFVHSETGLRTLGLEFEKVALHNETHLSQIRKALTDASL